MNTSRFVESLLPVERSHPIHPAQTRSPGNGPYLIDNLIKDGGNININGASLLVFYHDADPDNNVASYIVFEGNDSNVESIYEPGGWDSTLSFLSLGGAPAYLQLHVADGQIWLDADVSVNGTVIATGPQVFDGTSVPGGPGPGGWGSLWDIRTFNVDPLVTGLNTLRVTSPENDDCLSLVAAAVIVGGPSPATSVASVAPSQLSVTAVPTGSNGGRQ